MKVKINKTPVSQIRMALRSRSQQQTTTHSRRWVTCTTRLFRRATGAATSGTVRNRCFRATARQLGQCKSSNNSKRILRTTNQLKTKSERKSADQSVEQVSTATVVRKPLLREEAQILLRVRLQCGHRVDSLAKTSLEATM